MSRVSLRSRENDFGGLRFSCPRLPRHHNGLVCGCAASAEAHLVVGQLQHEHFKPTEMEAGERRRTLSYQFMSRCVVSREKKDGVRVRVSSAHLPWAPVYALVCVGALAGSHRQSIQYRGLFVSPPSCGVCQNCYRGTGLVVLFPRPRPSRICLLEK